MVLGSKNLWTIRQQMAKVTFLLPLPPQEGLGCPCYTESYSRSIAQRATPGLLHRELPGLLHRELLPVNCTESYSRSATPRATRSATPRATPGLLHRELLQVCYTESYSRSIAPSKSRSVEKGVKAKFRQLFFVNNDHTCLTKKRPHTIPFRERGSQTLWRTKSYSCSVEPRATPGHCTESYSRSIAPTATPGLLHRELLPVCYTESYSRFTETAACN